MRAIMVAVLTTVLLGAAVAEPASAMRLKPCVSHLLVPTSPRITGWTCH
jgi:hypothetical protein